MPESLNLAYLRVLVNDIVHLRKYALFLFPILIYSAGSIILIEPHIFDLGIILT